MTSSQRSLDGITDARFNLGFSLGVASQHKEGQVLVVDRGVINKINDGGDDEVLNLEEFAFLLGGGTISGQPDFPDDGVIKMRETDPIEKYLDFLRLEVNARVSTVAMLDSREMRAYQRLKLMKAISESDEDVIFVTYGTYQLAPVARLIKEKLADLPPGHPLLNKTIVFLGAMTPLRGYERTDADFNVGYSLGGVTAGKENMRGKVLLAMNGEFYDPDLVDKDTDKGAFVPREEVRGHVNAHQLQLPPKPDQGQKGEIKNGQFLCFKALDVSNLTVKSMDFSGQSRDYIDLEISDTLFPNEEDLFEEACSISFTLGYAVRFSGVREGFGPGFYFVHNPSNRITSLTTRFVQDAA